MERPALELGRLGSISLLSPDPYIFFHARTRREATLSSEIEGLITPGSITPVEAEKAPGVPMKGWEGL